MFRMGGSCSISRSHDEDDSTVRRRKPRGERVTERSTGISRKSLRHSVVCAIPDGSIADLYPVQDNYVNVTGNLRSPKSLADLCVDALCRSLPYLNGELPSGLPQDVVDEVINSLVQHSALTATTLRVLRNCELGTLTLANCRGVTDEWLEPFLHQSYTVDTTASFSLLESSSPSDYFNDQTDTTVLGEMDLGTIDGVETVIEDMEAMPTSDIFYGAFETHMSDQDCASSSSSSSFTSGHEYDERQQRPMDVVVNTLLPSQIKEDVSCASFDSSVTANLTLLDIRGSQGLSDRGLLHLTHLHNLQVAKLDQCHSLTGRGLLAFCQSYKLHTLSLANCRRLTDEAVINISHLASLQALSLDGCRCLTDRSLAAISELYNLKKLDLSQCDLITDTGLDELEHLELLQELSLGWCREISDEGLKRFTSHPGRDEQLKVLRLARCTITDDGVVYLSRLQALEELDLNGCASVKSTALGLTLDKLKRLTVLDVSHCPGIIRSGWQGKINALKSLELCYSSVKDSHIVKLLNLSALEELNLDSCPVGDRAIAHLADNNVVPNLTSLDLADTNLSDLGMVKIAKFTKLTRLSLFYCNISNSGLRHISTLVELQALNLDSREISDSGLSHLRTLTKLKSLDIFSGRITDTGCVHIASIRSLESLELCGGGIGDDGCTALAELESLSSLNLSQNERISNRGAAALAALTNLKALNLSNTMVNSSALRFFSGLRKLQSLALYGCRGIDDERVIGRLQNGLPNLKCLRLNTASAEDGMVVAESESDDDMLEESECAWIGEDAAVSTERIHNEAATASDDRD